MRHATPTLFTISPAAVLLVWSFASVLSGCRAGGPSAATPAARAATTEIEIVTEVEAEAETENEKATADARPGPPARRPKIWKHSRYSPYGPTGPTAVLGPDDSAPTPAGSDPAPSTAPAATGFISDLAVKLELATDRAEVAVGERVVVMEACVNTGELPVEVEFTGIDRDVVRVADYEDGAFVPLPRPKWGAALLSVEDFPSGQFWSHSSTESIPPGGESRCGGGSYRFRFTEPGVYRLQSTFGRGFFRRGIKSNPLEIRVIPAPPGDDGDVTTWTPSD